MRPTLKPLSELLERAGSSKPGVDAFAARARSLVPEGSDFSGEEVFAVLFAPILYSLGYSGGGPSLFVFRLPTGEYGLASDETFAGPYDTFGDAVRVLAYVLAEDVGNPDGSPVSDATLAANATLVVADLLAASVGRNLWPEGYTTYGGDRPLDLRGERIDTVPSTDDPARVAEYDEYRAETRRRNDR